MKKNSFYLRGVLLFLTVLVSGCLRISMGPGSDNFPGLESVQKTVGPKCSTSDWRYITLHHSATLEGNAACFDRNHLARNLGGLFYHFVIGNGTLSGNGEIETGWRWQKQEAANRPADIQICLVGNFCQETVGPEQLEALIKLIKVLRQQYSVPLGNIRRHKDIAGRATECPGTNFPFEQLLAALNKI